MSIHLFIYLFIYLFKHKPGTKWPKKDGACLCTIENLRELYCWSETLDHQRVKHSNSLPLSIQVLKLGSRWTSSLFGMYLKKSPATGIRKKTREQGPLVGRHALSPRFLVRSSWLASLVARNKWGDFAQAKYWMRDSSSAGTQNTRGWDAGFTAGVESASHYWYWLLIVSYRETKWTHS